MRWSWGIDSAMTAATRFPSCGESRFVPRTGPWTPLLPAPLSDSQCGFRIYPGPFLRDVPCAEDRFVLETEALVRAVRAGYRLVSVPVRSVYPAGRRSRFQAVSDATRIGWYLARARLGRRTPASVRPSPLATGPRLAGEL